MQTSNEIEIFIRNTQKPETALRLLSEPNSGFRVDVAKSDMRPKLRVGIEVCIAIVGLVIKLSELAVSIYKIIHAEQEKPEPTSQTAVILSKGNLTIAFVNQTVEEIQEILEKFQRETNG